MGNLNNSRNGLSGLAPLNTLGAEREGPRRENYELTLSACGKTWTCNVPESVWGKYREGTTTPIKVRMTGGADCGSLR